MKNVCLAIIALLLLVHMSCDAAIIAELSMNEEDLKHYSCCAGTAPFYFNK